jgi:hypothetical protein
MIDYDGCVGVQVMPDNPNALLHFFIKIHQILIGEEELKQRKLKNKQMELELKCIDPGLNPDLHITGGNWHVRNNNVVGVHNSSNRSNHKCDC